jgi:hypothetical protein
MLQGENSMIDYLKPEFLGTIAITAGSIVSKPFAASVIAGALGVFIACAILFARRYRSV